MSKSCTTALESPETERYATLNLIDWFDRDRINGARVLVVGAGAIGNETLKNLALLGVGTILILDRDQIELSNLSRSVLFRASDRGKFKAETAARALKELNPLITPLPLVGDLRFDLGLGLIRRMDVIIGCLDNLEARIFLNQKCFSVFRPWIEAGINQLDGQVQVFHPGQGACYECYTSDQSYTSAGFGCEKLASLYEQQGKVPTTPTIASIVAGVQVQETLKLLDLDRWRDKTLISKMFLFDGTHGQVQIAGLERNPDCSAHAHFDLSNLIELTEVTATGTTARELLTLVTKLAGSPVTIRLNCELALEFECHQCQTREPVLKPMRKVFREQALCLICDQPRELNTTHAIYLGHPKMDDSILDQPLQNLGIPPLDILYAFSADGSGMYVELTGDQAIFGGNHS